MQPEGSVMLVGAGPGAVDLMTVRALRAVEGAEALLYDALVSDEAVALAPQRCLRIQTGKRSGKTSMSQDAINRLMLKLARRGLKVVRLKGGDPSIFGRSGEERDFLESHGVAVEVVPGVTAASAAAAQFAFPLTHRGASRRLVLTTARLDGGADAEDWRAAADPEATVAVYMGGERAAELSARLIAAGRPARTPVLLIEAVSTPKSRVVFEGTLQSLASAALSLGEGPVLTVIGEVAAMARTCARELTPARSKGAARP